MKNNDDLGWIWACIFFVMFIFGTCDSDKTRKALKSERVDRCEKEWKMPKQWCLGQAEIDKW